MRLIEAERHPWSNERQLTPKDKFDFGLFSHCTGGSISVTEEAFFETYLPVFKAHGIECTLPTDFVLSMKPIKEGGK